MNKYQAQEEKILEFVEFNEGLTPKEISKEFPQWEQSSVTARISELVDSQQLVYGDRRKCNTTGHSAQTVYLAKESNKHLLKEKKEKTISGEYDIDTINLALLQLEFFRNKDINESVKNDYFKYLKNNHFEVKSQEEFMKKQIQLAEIMGRYKK
jgi:hypothetical protein